MHFFFSILYLIIFKDSSTLSTAATVSLFRQRFGSDVLYSAWSGHCSTQSGV